MSTHSADPDPEIVNLLFYPADEIQYDSLSTVVLSKLATQMEDPFIATLAIGELAQRDPRDTIDAAKRVLDRKPWDAHLTAYALTLLYTRDPDEAIARMENLIPTPQDAPILEAMIENILSDAAIFQAMPGQALARTVARQVTAAEPRSFYDIEQRDEFLRLFADDAQDGHHD